eukprot:8545751-Pyramimonas_sp.AAC.1
MCSRGCQRRDPPVISRPVAERFPSPCWPGLTCSWLAGQTNFKLGARPLPSPLQGQRSGWQDARRA